ncbi:hypothetical protein GCM10023339_08800 [Alloalcanivorax gelatiniphagus]
MNTSSRRSGARSRSTSPLAGPLARPLAGSLVVLALAAGLSSCGSDDGDGTPTDPAGSSSPPSPTETPTEPTESSTGTPTEKPGEPADGAPTPIAATGSAGVSEAVLVHATEGDGSPSTFAFALDTDQAVQDFVVGLRSGLPERVTAAVADVSQQSPDATPYGAIVSTGCEAPRSVAIDAGEAGFEVVPALPKSTVQCLAPVTYVVVFAAPDA